MASVPTNTPRHTDAPSCPLPSRKSLSIAGRIWLSFSLLILGYTVIMLQGAWVGSYTQEKNNLISSHLFPAALKAQTITTSYKEQNRQFEEAILSGEMEQLQQAQLKTELIIGEMTAIIADQMVPPLISSHAKTTLQLYQNFVTGTMPVYTRMLTFSPDEELLAQAAALSRQAQQLLHDFDHLEKTLARETQTQLHDITAENRRHKHISIAVFVGAVSLSLILVSFIVHRSISTPLRETVELANFMASGDLSRKLTIRHHDEIGELAKAMNVMAGELESSYSEMGDRVKRRTAKLEQANKKMGLEVERRQRTQKELAKALDAAKSSDKAKSSFLANMSHEIRTPMNGIIGMASLLANSALGPNQQRYITTIKNSAESLLQILNDILDFSKVEAGKLELDNTEFNPHATLTFVTELFATQTQEKELNLFTLVDPAVPTLISGDEGRLRQVLLNLVGNAIKFTMQGDIAIRVTVEEVMEEQLTIHFAVSDTGLGIPAEKLRNLFQPFTQADASTTRKYGGTGLGLSISQSLVELMGGRITAESKEKVGSTFHFTCQFQLPSDEMEPLARGSGLIYSEQKPRSIEEGGDPSQDKTALHGKHILVVDDDDTNLIVTEAILETIGCSSSMAHDGQEAATMARKEDFDLILMDSQMPEMSGMEATAAIRRLRSSNDPQLKRRGATPIIALTADGVKGARDQYLAAGMDDYLGKPIRPETLLACLTRWLAMEQRPTFIFPRQRLLKRLGGSEEELRQMIRQASTDIPQLLAKLKKACIDNNYSLVVKPCLALKNIGASLGIASVQHQALHLCLAAENNKCNPDLLKEFEKTLEEVVKQINSAG
ncbi:MAG: ATP-binding protein [Thermodesulfobacteriota bacterium]